jgi:hypothetical protein
MTLNTRFISYTTKEEGRKGGKKGRKRGNERREKEGKRKKGLLVFCMKIHRQPNKTEEKAHVVCIIKRLRLDKHLRYYRIRLQFCR